MLMVGRVWSLRGVAGCGGCWWCSTAFSVGCAQTPGENSASTLASVLLQPSFVALLPGRPGPGRARPQPPQLRLPASPSATPPRPPRAASVRAPYRWSVLLLLPLRVLVPGACHMLDEMPARTRCFSRDRCVPCCVPIPGAGRSRRLRAAAAHLRAAFPISMCYPDASLRVPDARLHVRPRRFPVSVHDAVSVSIVKLPRRQVLRFPVVKLREGRSSTLRERLPVPEQRRRAKFSVMMTFCAGRLRARP